MKMNEKSDSRSLKITLLSKIKIQGQMAAKKMKIAVFIQYQTMTIFFTLKIRDNNDSLKLNSKKDPVKTR